LKKGQTALRSSDDVRQMKIKYRMLPGKAIVKQRVFTGRAGAA
jgi:hypothetical protein